jgi:excisionase family DNA binding protein
MVTAVVADPGDDRCAWLSVQEAARALGVVSRTVYGLINAGELPGHRIGRVIRVRREDLDRYLESARIQPGALDHLCGTALTRSPGDAAS